MSLCSLKFINSVNFKLHGDEKQGTAFILWLTLWFTE